MWNDISEHIINIIKKKLISACLIRLGLFLSFIPNVGTKSDLTHQWTSVRPRNRVKMCNVYKLECHFNRKKEKKLQNASKILTYCH